jgi:hypothetical protein
MDLNNSISTKFPENWSKEDVGRWLLQIDLPQYKEIFESINIDGSLLF